MKKIWSIITSIMLILSTFGLRTSSPVFAEASGTDIIEDSAELKEALESGSMEDVYLEAGQTYIITSTIEINRYVNIFGNGAKLVASEDLDPMIRFRSGSRGTSITGLDFENSSYTDAIVIESNLNGLTISDCNFICSDMSEDAITVTQPNQNITIEGCDFTGDWDKCVAVERDGSYLSDLDLSKEADITIRGNSFSSDETGIYIGGVNVYIAENVFLQKEETRFGDDKIVLSRAKNIIIDDNYFSLINDVVLQSFKSNSVQFQNNLVDGLYIEMNGDQNIEIGSNVFKENVNIDVSPYVDGSNDQSSSNILIKDNTIPKGSISLTTYNSFGSPETTPPLPDDGVELNLNSNYWGFSPSLYTVLTGAYKDQYVNGKVVDLANWYETPPVAKTQDPSEIKPFVEVVEAVLNTQLILNSSKDGSCILSDSTGKEYQADSTPIEFAAGLLLSLKAVPNEGFLFDGITIEKTVPDFPSAETAVDVEYVDDEAKFKKPDYAITITPTFVSEKSGSIEFNPDQLQLTVGESIALAPVIEPLGTELVLTWSSSQPSVASVDQNGKVTAISAGTAEITAEGNGLKATCQVTVVSPETPRPPQPSPTPTPTPTPGPSNPDDSPNNGPATEDDFKPNSGINAGVSGTGPGFTENGSTTSQNTADNTQITYTQNSDGSKAATTQNADGQITSSVITIPDSAIEAQDGSIRLSLGENSIENQTLSVSGEITNDQNAPELTINLPSANRKVKVEVPIEAGTLSAGTVALIEEEGRLTPIPTSFFDEETSTLGFSIMGSQRVIIANNALAFADEDQMPDYAREAAAYTSARDLMTGMGLTLPKPFDFDGYTTRGQFATILWRVENRPESSGTYPEGIIPEAWNAQAARWAVERKLMAQGGSLFYPERDITREEIVAVLWRLENEPQASLSLLDPYQDAEEIQSEDFKRAMAWGVENKLIGQDEAKRLYPKEFAIRAEVAAIYQRFIQNVLN